MAGLSNTENQQMRLRLQDAVVKCSERGLYQSAKWYGMVHSYLHILEGKNGPTYYSR